MFISRFLGRSLLLMAAIGITQVFAGGERPNVGPSVPELSPISVSTLLGLPPAGQVAPENSKRPCTGCNYVDEPTDFVLQGSYYDTRRFDVTLILNNKGPDPLPVELTVYSLHGRRLDLPPQELPAQSANMLSLNELLRDAGAPFREGSLEVRYRYEGCALVLSAGILLENPSAGISFDELLTRTFQRASNRLEGLWWVPSRGSKLELVLSNKSESEVTATVSGRSLGRTAERRSLSVNLGPRDPRAQLAAGVDAREGDGPRSVGGRLSERDLRRSPE